MALKQQLIRALVKGGWIGEKADRAKIKAMNLSKSEAAARVAAYRRRFDCPSEPDEYKEVAERFLAAAAARRKKPARAKPAAAAKKRPAASQPESDAQMLSRVLAEEAPGEISDAVIEEVLNNLEEKNQISDELVKEFMEQLLIEAESATEKASAPKTQSKAPKSSAPKTSKPKAPKARVSSKIKLPSLQDFNVENVKIVNEMYLAEDDPLGIMPLVLKKLTNTRWSLEAAPLLLGTPLYGFQGDWPYDQILGEMHDENTQNHYNARVILLRDLKGVRPVQSPFTWFISKYNALDQTKVLDEVLTKAIDFNTQPFQETEKEYKAFRTINSISELGGPRDIREFFQDLNFAWRGLAAVLAYKPNIIKGWERAQKEYVKEQKINASDPELLALLAGPQSPPSEPAEPPEEEPIAALLSEIAEALPPGISEGEIQRILDDVEQADLL